jgi:transposase-like protein
MSDTPVVSNVWTTAQPRTTARERPVRLSPEPLVKIVDGMPCREAAAMLGINAGTLQKWRKVCITQRQTKLRATL